MRRSAHWLLWIGCCSCATAPAEQNAADAAVVVSEPPPAPVTEVAAVIPPPPTLNASVYPAAFRKALLTRTRGRALEPVAPHSLAVSVLRPKKKVLVTTSTLGARRRNLTAVPVSEQRVELVAHVPRATAGVVDVLRALAPRLFRANDPLRLYEAVSLKTPVHGLSHFDVLPGGEVTVMGERVTLYKVVPLSLEEFEAAKSTKGSQWVGAEAADRDAAGRTMRRWGPALDPD